MILNGRTTLGIECGSTRIKAILIGEDYATIASGSYDWENHFMNGIWTYSLEDVWKGIQHSYANMLQHVKEKYGVTIRTIGAIGFSAMMHGYMVFDKDDNLLVPFRTWRNTITGEAADKLTEAFTYNIPQRWSISHLYQAILNKEEHVKDITFITTLSGYIHWKLTGNKVLGVGDASGMFPIDIKSKNFNNIMLEKFHSLVIEQNYPWKIQEILPTVLVAGEEGGRLSGEGARCLDISGDLKAGILVCPPEGDAGTGMVATNSVAVCRGNVSAGTSIFAMIVLEKELSRVYKEIDLVTTPNGDLVAMVHCNNCTSDLNAWVNLFKEFAESFGMEADMDKLFSVLYNKALEGDPDCGGLLAYNYFSGEHITGFEEGRPLFARRAEDKFNLSNFMRVHLFSSLGALKTGLNILFMEEEVRVDKILGHGGLFKTKEVGQRVLAAAMDTPVSVMETAGEGGAWGIGILAAYMDNKTTDESLSNYLSEHVFKGQEGTTVWPEEKDTEGFEQFMERYKEGLPIERAAITNLK